MKAQITLVMQRPVCCLSEMRTGRRGGEKNESKASKGYLTTKDTKDTKKGE